MLIMKFGGTSIAEATIIQKTLQHIRQVADTGEPLVVVISALAQVTNQLTQITTLIPEYSESALKQLDLLLVRHLQIAEQLMDQPRQSQLCIECINCYGLQLKSLIKNLTTSPTEQQSAYIIAHGELLSSTLIYHLMQAFTSCQWLDARKLLVTDQHYLQAKIMLETSIANIRQKMFPIFKQTTTLITQGFIAGTTTGETTLLGREGSDYSATLFGAALQAREVQIWTDVPGIMTADPSLVPDARLIPNLAYDTATELATLGARVIHPLAMEPVKQAKIPIRILNTHQCANQTGTLIDAVSFKTAFTSLIYRKGVIFLRVNSTADWTPTDALHFIQAHPFFPIHWWFENTSLHLLITEENWQFSQQTVTASLVSTIHPCTLITILRSPPSELTSLIESLPVKILGATPSKLGLILLLPSSDHLPILEKLHALVVN